MLATLRTLNAEETACAGKSTLEHRELADMVVPERLLVRGTDALQTRVRAPTNAVTGVLDP